MIANHFGLDGLSRLAAPRGYGTGIGARRDGRNRVLLARRNLPWPLAAVYLADWMALTMARERSAASLRPWFAGFTEGWRTDPGSRQPISLRTAWRMTRAGRPPII